MYCACHGPRGLPSGPSSHSFCGTASLSFLTSGNFCPGAKTIVSTGAPSFHFWTTRATLTTINSRSDESSLPSPVSQVASLVNLINVPWITRPVCSSSPSTSSVKPSKPSRRGASGAVGSCFFTSSLLDMINSPLICPSGCRKSVPAAVFNFFTSLLVVMFHLSSCCRGFRPAAVFCFSQKLGWGSRARSALHDRHDRVDQRWSDQLENFFGTELRMVFECSAKDRNYFSIDEALRRCMRARISARQIAVRQHGAEGEEIPISSAVIHGHLSQLTREIV